MEIPLSPRLPVQLPSRIVGLTQVEIAALIAAGAAVITGAGSAFVTYKITNRSIKASHDEGEATRSYDAGQREKDRNHDLEVHRQDRAFQRKADACVSVAVAITWTHDFVTWWNQKIVADNSQGILVKLPSLTQVDVIEDAPPVPPEDWGSMTGLTNLFLDDDTKASVNRLQWEFLQFQAHVAVLRSFDDPDSPIADKADALRPRLIEVAQASAEKVRTGSTEAMNLLRAEIERLT
jgi:hypothetical protein